ncbi:hypothetical protein BUH_4728 [Burkholderia pseudomallei Pakistan 9]|nr:hypothetical protein BUH_4728 [Burkholderia pseudomallei Pakistan 9]
MRARMSIRPNTCAVDAARAAGVLSDASASAAHALWASAASV